MRGKALDTKDCPNGIKRKLSRNARNQKKKIREKIGSKFPGTQKRHYSEIRRMGIANGQRQFARKWMHWRGSGYFSTMMQGQSFIGMMDVNMPQCT
eukprot:13057189-Ditylum_brightwellii.AAC.1